MVHLPSAVHAHFSSQEGLSESNIVYPRHSRSQLLLSIAREKKSRSSDRTKSRIHNLSIKRRCRAYPLSHRGDPITPGKSEKKTSSTRPLTSFWGALPYSSHGHFYFQGGLSGFSCCPFRSLLIANKNKFLEKCFLGALTSLYARTENWAGF